MFIEEVQTLLIIIKWIKLNILEEKMIEKVKKQVYELLNKDNSGHGNDHIDRVLNLSLKFAEKETANKDVVALIDLYVPQFLGDPQ